jgi:hypothetical protein
MPRHRLSTQETVVGLLLAVGFAFGPAFVASVAWAQKATRGRTFEVPCPSEGTPAVLMPSNTARVAWSIYHPSTQTVLLGFGTGTTALSSGSNATPLPTGAGGEFGNPFTGEFRCAAKPSTATVYVTEEY